MSGESGFPSDYIDPTDTTLAGAVSYSGTIKSGSDTDVCNTDVCNTTCAIDDVTDDAIGNSLGSPISPVPHQATDWHAITRPWQRFVHLRSHGRLGIAHAFDRPDGICVLATKKGPL